MLSFTSVHYAIRAEKALRDAGIDVISLPTPREIDISCGQCLLFAGQFEHTVLSILEQSRILWSMLYRREVELRKYEKIAEYGR